MTSHGESSELETASTAALAEGGAIARISQGFRHRDAQTQMARAVARCIEQRDVLAIEAGTGVGKTFAYLVPVLLSGRRALISTATKSLQDQLYRRDLPRVLEALQMPVSSALLKGRESYLCLLRMKMAVASDDLVVTASRRTLARVERWAQATRTGDLAEVEGLDEQASIMRHVTSTRENCLGSQCPDFQACHVVRARREAMAADLVVVNHHLFFADIVLRDTGMAELLPTVDVAVFDEAHHLVDTGVQFLGHTVSTAQAIDFARDVLAAGLTHARGLAPWAQLAQGVDLAARDLRLAVGDQGTSRTRWPDGSSAFDEALSGLAESSGAALEAARSCTELDPVFDSLCLRATELSSKAQHLRRPAPEFRARWIDVMTHHVRLIETPLDITAAMAEQRQRAPRSWIFTSATLGEDEALSWFTQPTGLAAELGEGVTTVKLGSPYDHANLARLWACVDAPRPDDPSHGAYVGRVAGQCAAILEGRTIVLTTTLRAMSRIADALRTTLRQAGSTVRVVMQGDQPKTQLLDALRDQPGTVLVASQSFWEGVDVPGDALQCVVIDKLPFPPPNDPLIEARARRIEASGGSAFNACFLAEAAISLKQGAGRLIRSETDRGLLVVCDPRLSTMGYGRRLIRAMPPMARVHTWDEAHAWLRSMAVPVHDTVPRAAQTRSTED